VNKSQEAAKHYSYSPSFLRKSNPHQPSATISDKTNANVNRPSLIAGGEQPISNFTVQEIEAQVKIAKLEKELNKARQEMLDERKKRYKEQDKDQISTSTSQMTSAPTEIKSETSRIASGSDYPKE